MNPKQMAFFQQDDLLTQQRATDRPYLEFWRVPDITAGLYVLAAGATDAQSPHSEDEIYVVLNGRGHFMCEGESRPVAPGDIIYVPKYAVHRFFDISEKLDILVIFAPAEGDMGQRRQTTAVGSYEVSTDPHRLDVDFIHHFLTRSYWASGITREQVTQSLRHSFGFGIYNGAQQVGFGRVITDFTTFAYIADVFVDADHRGRGLGQALIGAMLAHPDLQGMRRWCLFTRDAHELYRRFGFQDFEQVPTYMEYRP